MINEQENQLLEEWAYDEKYKKQLELKIPYIEKLKVLIKTSSQEEIYNYISTFRNELSGTDEAADWLYLNLPTKRVPQKTWMAKEILSEEEMKKSDILMIEIETLMDDPDIDETIISEKIEEELKLTSELKDNTKLVFINPDHDKLFDHILHYGL